MWQQLNKFFKKCGNKFDWLLWKWETFRVSWKANREWRANRDRVSKAIADELFKHPIGHKLRFLLNGEPYYAIRESQWKTKLVKEENELY
jgi:hypothetical protein